MNTEATILEALEELCKVQTKLHSLLREVCTHSKTHIECNFRAVPSDEWIICDICNQIISEN